MTTRYEIIDEIITEMLGEPDHALGGYVLDRGNLQAFAARAIHAHESTMVLDKKYQ